MLLRTPRLITLPDQTKTGRFSQPLARHVGRVRGQVQRETGQAFDQFFERCAHITFARILGIGPVAEDVAVAALGLQTDAADDRVRRIVDDKQPPLTCFALDRKSVV